MRKETFNDFLMAVDRVRNRTARKDLGYDWRENRGQAFYTEALRLRPELGPKLIGTKRDPRGLSGLQLDTWLGWFVHEWNGTSQPLRRRDAKGDGHGER